MAGRMEKLVFAEVCVDFLSPETLDRVLIGWAVDGESPAHAQRRA